MNMIMMKKIFQINKRSKKTKNNKIPQNPNPLKKVIPKAVKKRNNKTQIINMIQIQNSRIHLKINQRKV